MPKSGHSPIAVTGEGSVEENAMDTGTEGHGGKG